MDEPKQEHTNVPEMAKIMRTIRIKESGTKLFRDTQGKMGKDAFKVLFSNPPTSFAELNEYHLS